METEAIQCLCFTPTFIYVFPLFRPSSFHGSTLLFLSSIWNVLPFRSFLLFPPMSKLLSWPHFVFKAFLLTFFPGFSFLSHSSSFSFSVRNSLRRLRVSRKDIQCPDPRPEWERASTREGQYDLNAFEIVPVSYFLSLILSETKKKLNLVLRFLFLPIAIFVAEYIALEKEKMPSRNGGKLLPYPFADGFRKFTRWFPLQFRINCAVLIGRGMSDGLFSHFPNRHCFFFQSRRTALFFGFVPLRGNKIQTCHIWSFFNDSGN